MSGLVKVTAWLMLGHALVGGAYAAFIHTPESNVLMLGVSVALVVAGASALLWTSASAARALHANESPWRGWRQVVGMLPGVLVAVLVVGAACWTAGLLGDAWAARAGEVDAAAIAAGDVTNTRWLHTAVRWGVTLVQWVIVPVWLATSLAWAAAYGSRHVVTLKWLVAALTPRVVLVGLVGVVLLVWLPWRGVHWRPSGLASTTMEMAFTGTKLLGLYAAVNLAWALLLDAAARTTRR